MPRGGVRVGAGRPRKSRADALLTGSRQRGPVGVVKSAESSSEDVNVAKVDLKPPKTLSDEEKAFWTELAPLATAQGTLTAASAMAFADLCTFIVVERKLRQSALHAAGADHRGMMKQVEILRARFRLIPDGKPVEGLQPAKDEFDEFDGPKLVNRA